MWTTQKGITLNRNIQVSSFGKHQGKNLVATVKVFEAFMHYDIRN